MAQACDDAVCLAMGVPCFWASMGSCRVIPLLAAVCRRWRDELPSASEIVRHICPSFTVTKSECRRVLGLGSSVLSRLHWPVFLHAALAAAENKKGGLQESIRGGLARKQERALAALRARDADLDTRLGGAPDRTYCHIARSLADKWPAWTVRQVIDRANEIYRRR